MIRDTLQLSPHVLFAIQELLTFAFVAVHFGAIAIRSVVKGKAIREAVVLQLKAELSDEFVALD